MKLNCKGCKYLVTGFHGIGFVGFIAVDYLVRKLKAERVGFYTNDFLPALSFYTDKRIETPVEFYRYKDVLFLKVNVLIEKEDVNEMINEIFSNIFSKRSSIKELFVIGGLSSPEQETKVFGVWTSKAEEIAKKMRLRRYPKELTIFGPMAAVLNYGEINDLPTVAVLSTTSGMMPDPKASSKAIKKIAPYLGIKISTKSLEKESKKIEERLKEIKKKDDMAERMFV